jgi:hypothetical protein
VRTISSARASGAIVFALPNEAGGQVANYRTLFSSWSTRAQLSSLPKDSAPDDEPVANPAADHQSAPEVAPASTAPMGRTSRRLIGIWIMALFAVALGHLPWAWSLAEQVATAKHPVHAHWFGLEFVPQKAAMLLIVVLTTALIGSAATLALTFAHRVGYQKLEKGWEWWYIMRPPTAAGIGVLAFALLEAGLFSSTTAVKSSLLAAAATGGLAGLFTDQLLQKMRAALGLSAFGKSASDEDEKARTNAK